MRCVALIALAVPVLGFSQGDPASIERIIGIGKHQNRAFKTLETFCDAFGPRLTGSPQLAAAQNWAVKEFKSYGLSNVTLEKWGEVPVGFYRGPRQSVKLVAPWTKEFVFTTPAWTPGTNGKVTVKPILAPSTLAELESMKDKLNGAWLVMTRPSGIRGPQGEASQVEQELNKLNIAGKIWGTNDERVHTGGRFTGLTYDNLPKTVDIRVRKSDFTTLTRLLKGGTSPQLELDIENHFVKGPVPQYNVIADLPGTEKPDEYVIICGHFDSWNGPGSKGANDNGTGSSVTLESARILAKSGVKPKRTIRFILWSGEEQGLLGSRAYVEMHKELVPKIAAVFNDDGGTNYQGGYRCTENMKDMLEAAIKPSQAAFPELPMKIEVQPQFPAGGSSDHAPFAWAGVPAFFSIESGKADYGYVWHTQHDRPEFSVAEYLTQSSTNAALVAFNIANADKMLPRVPITTRGASGSVAGGTKMFYRPGFYFEHDHKAGDDHDHEDEYLEFVVDSLARWMIGN